MRIAIISLARNITLLEDVALRKFPIHIVLFFSIIATEVVRPALSPAMAQNVAVRARMECVGRNIAKVDDGHMDPRHLALAIRPMCHAQHESAMQATMLDAWRKTPRTQANELEIDHTLAAVLYFKRQR